MKRNRKSAYVADEMESNEVKEHWMCNAYGCKLRGDTSWTTRAKSGKFYCRWHDGRPVQSFDAITVYLKSRNQWFEYVNISSRVGILDYNNILTGKQEVKLPKSLQPSPNLNFMLWKKMVRSIIYSRIDAEVKEIVDCGAHPSRLAENSGLEKISQLIHEFLRTSRVSA